MRACILLNAYYNDESYLYQAYRMRDEFAAANVPADIVRNDDFVVTIEDGALQNKLRDYDVAVCWDKDKYVLQALDRLGVPLYNGCRAVTLCDDKMSTYIALSNAGIPMPDTLPGLLCFRPEEPIRMRSAEAAERALGYPMVIKEAYGSLGRGVYLVRDRNELMQKAEEVKCKPHLLQRFVATSAGRDLRVIVVGDTVLGGMLRVSSGDFRSNIGAGGTGTAYAVPPDVQALARKVAKLLGLDYCGIDFLFGEHGFTVCEVNSNAFFQTFERVTGCNVAKAYVQHILRTQLKEKV